MVAKERRDVVERSDISPGEEVRIRVRARVRGWGCVGWWLSA